MCSCFFIVFENNDHRSASHEKEKDQDQIVGSDSDEFDNGLFSYHPEAVTDEKQEADDDPGEEVAKNMKLFVGHSHSVGVGRGL